METERRDSKGSLTLQGYDHGNRPTQLWARNHPGDATTLRQKLLYGDTEDLADNFKGKLYRHYDEAGLVEVHGYDFKGNPLASSRRTIRDEVIRPYLGKVEYQAFTVDWATPEAETFYLETKTYRSDTAFDALNRPKRVVFPEDISGERKVLRPTYNRAGALESVSLQSPNGNPQAGVAYLAYNAKGQRSLLALANGLMTRCEYDPHTFRLVRLRTEKYQREGDSSFVPDGGLLQDLAYHYDLAGNITQIQDRGTGKGINGLFAFDRDFSYDAIYRLLSGTGIEHSAYTHASEPWLEMMQHHNNDLSQARPYRQRYTYDPAGNILELAHRNLNGEAGHFTRRFSVEAANNRLRRMEQNNHAYAYSYDSNGNMTREATNHRYHWNHADQLSRFSNQTEGSAPTVDACYLYGADGIRVKKIMLKGGGLLKTTTYISEVFEYCTRGDAEHNMIHLMDGKQRIALLRVGAPFSGDETNDPALQYILGDHLGNSNMTANHFGALLHREEFTPYGETSFGGYGEKRYRFTGQERDEESGLSYHRARYYAGWLGRWVSADPMGAIDGINIFVYSKCSPICLNDGSGNGSKKPDGNQEDVDDEIYYIPQSTNDTFNLFGEDYPSTGNWVQRPVDILPDDITLLEICEDTTPQSPLQETCEAPTPQPTVPKNTSPENSNQDNSNNNSLGPDVTFEVEDEEVGFHVGDETNSVWDKNLVDTSIAGLDIKCDTKGIYAYGKAGVAGNSEKIGIKGKLGVTLAEIGCSVSKGPMEINGQLESGLGIEGDCSLSSGRVVCKGKFAVVFGGSGGISIDIREIFEGELVPLTILKPIRQF